MRKRLDNLNMSLVTSYFVLIVIIFLSLFSILNLEITGGAVVGFNKVGIPLENLSEELVNHSFPNLADPKEEDLIEVPEKELVEDEPAPIKEVVVPNVVPPSFENDVEAFYIEIPTGVSSSGALPDSEDFIILNSTDDFNFTDEDLTVSVSNYTPEEEMISYNLNFQKNSESLGLANFPMDIEEKTIATFQYDGGIDVPIDPDHGIFDGGFGNDIEVGFFDPIDPYPDYFFSDMIAEDLPILDWCQQNYPQCVFDGLSGFAGLIYGTEELLEMGSPGPIIMTGEERWFSQAEYQTNPLVVELVRDYTAYGLESADINGNSFSDLVTYSPTGFSSMNFDQPGYFQGRSINGDGKVSSNEDIRDLDGVHISGKIDIIFGGADGFQPGQIDDLSDITIVENFKQSPPINFWELGSSFYFDGDLGWTDDPSGDLLTADQINRRIGNEYLNNLWVGDLDANGQADLVYGSYNCGKVGEGCIFIVMDYMLTQSSGSKKTFFNNNPEDPFYNPNYDVGCIPSYSIYCGDGDIACGNSIAVGNFNGVGSMDLAFSSGTKMDDGDYVYIVEDLSSKFGEGLYLGQCFDSMSVDRYANRLSNLNPIIIDLNSDSELGKNSLFGAEVGFADLDKDGKDDLVTTATLYNGGKVMILQGRADSSRLFNSLGDFYTIDGPPDTKFGTGLKIYDHNNDGYDDVAVGSFVGGDPFNPVTSVFYGNEIFFQGGCTESDACNYDPSASIDDGSCAINDCNGECGGSAELDVCGVCGGAGIPEGDCDCFGNGIPDNACDCDGNVLDACGICGGDGSSCQAVSMPGGSDPVEATMPEGSEPPMVSIGSKDNNVKKDQDNKLSITGIKVPDVVTGGIPIGTYEDPGSGDVIVTSGITRDISSMITYQDIVVTNNYANEPKYGTLKNSPELRSDGVTNGAYYFRGIYNGDRISVKRVTEMEDLSHLTLSAWIYPLGTSAEGGYGLDGIEKVLGNSDDWDGEGFNFYLRSTEDEQYAFTINGSFVRARNVIFDQWQQLVGTYDGETMKLYVDGELIGSRGDVSTRVVSNLNLLIGDIPNYEYREGFNGMIDEVRVYDFAMTSDQIIENYNSDLQEKKDIALNMPLDSNLWDYSPFKYDITNHGASDLPGQVGDSYDFNSASSEYIEIDSSENLDVQNFTFSSWFNYRAIGSSSPAIYMRGNNLGGNELFIGFRLNYTNTIFITLDGSSYFFEEATDLIDSQWHHIAVRYDSSTLTVYIDGVQYGNSEPTIKILDFEDSNAYIGADVDSFNSNLGNYWNGGIDELKLFSRALSEEEILGIYNIENRGDKYIREIDRTILSNYTSLGDVFNTKVTQFYPNFTRKESVFSNNLTIRDNTLPVINSAILNSTDPSTNHTNENLTAHVQVTDDDGDNTKLLYDWYVNGELITVLNLPFEREQVIFTSDFESEDTGSYSCGDSQILDDPFWSNVGENGVFNPEDWTVMNYNTNTGSSSTGPNADHTVGDSTGKFLYFETSTPCFGGDDEAWLMSIPIDFDTYSEEQLTFWYHMYGANMGTLYVEENSTGSWEVLWELTGQQQTSEGEAWRDTTIDLTDISGEGNLRIRGVSGPLNTSTDFTSDMALDDISFNAKHFNKFNLNGGVFDNYNLDGGFDGFGSFDFDGIDDYLEIENSEQLNVQDFTFSSWFKTSGSSDSSPVIYMRSNNLGDNELFIGFRLNYTNTIFITLDDSDYYFEEAINLMDSQWHHIVVTYDSSNLRVYIDGVQYGDTLSAVKTLDFGDSNAWVGAEVDSFNSNFGNYWDGFIDDVILYNRALSPEQVAVLFENKTDEIVSQETKSDEVWKFDVAAYDLFGLGESMKSNNLTIGEDSDKNITVWIDGLESFTFPETGDIYSVRINAKENSLPVEGLSLGIMEANGWDLGYPLMDSEIKSYSIMSKLTNSSGDVELIFIPTRYGISDEKNYSLSAVLLDDSGNVLQEVPLFIGEYSGLTTNPGKTFDDESQLISNNENILSLVLSMNSWAQAGKGVKHDVYVKADGSTEPAVLPTLQSGALNVINITYQKPHGDLFPMESQGWALNSLSKPSPELFFKNKLSDWISSAGSGYLNSGKGLNTSSSSLIYMMPSNYAMESSSNFTVLVVEPGVQTTLLEFSSDNVFRSPTEDDFDLPSTEENNFRTFFENILSVSFNIGGGIS